MLNMSGNIDESFKKSNNNDDSRDGVYSQNDNQGASSYDQYSKTKGTPRKIGLSDNVSNSAGCIHTRAQTRSCYSTPVKSLDKSDLNITYYLSDSDSSESEKCCIAEKHYLIKKKKLPPVGVFWDIENCRIPKGRSAISVAQLIRDLFFTGYREAEFLVVCDVKKESNEALQELHDAQITLIHVASTCKNAADEKLRQAMRRFADTYSAPAAVILISGDVNFAADLSDLRHRKKIHVILIHLENTAEALILCASEHYNYTNLTQALPLKEIKTPVSEPMEVIVRNLPPGYDPVKLKQRLRQISDNCGGRVVYVSSEIATAVVRFSSFGVAIRAQRRMDGEDVYGHKISVSFPTPVRNWDKSYSPHRHSGRRVMRNSNQDMYCYGHPSAYGIPPPNPNIQLPLDYYSNHPPPQNFFEPNSGTISKSNQENHVFNHIEPLKKNYTPISTPVAQSLEGARYISKSQNAGVAGDYVNESWRQTSVSFSETQKRNRTPADNGSNRMSWPGSNMTGSFNALNVIGNEEPEFQFQSTTNIVRSNSLSNPSSASSPVELLVTNIDQTMDPQELKRILLSMFKEHVMVVSLTLFHQSDGNLAASVRVSSAQDAQYVISQLHRRKVGHKRVVISNAQASSPNPHILRTQVIALLQEVPGNRMPLFKFRELLESRYRTSVSVSELYKLRDVCTVNDELGGRMITLSSEFCTTPSRNLNMQMGIEVPHCVIHCPNGMGERGWAEPEMPSLPNVRYKLKVFTCKVHKLLNSHMGTLPLPSFAVCYEMEIGEKLCTDETGVPLEHLVTCVVGVELHLGLNMVKYLGWGGQPGNEESSVDENSGSTTINPSGPMKCVSPPLATQLALFSRELVDLLKTAPHCQLPFSRFIPAYHHHFGRQCRVADYGYTKLVDLFDALSHVVQVIGEGNKRFITLSHTAQIRRFTSDLLRVLKSQASKQVILMEFPAAYERVLSRPFDPVDYGLCDIEDLLEEVSENTVVMKTIGDDIYIAIPKKEQTSEEILRTKQFAVEVVDLLRHAPQYGMLFNKFVPAYHHHFGHQCRVSDYGFTKLIELFEAIPDVVKIEETSDGERRVSLIAKEALKVVCDQITALVNSSRLQSIPLVALPSTFLREHGYTLRPELYECESVDEVISRLSDSLQLVPSVAGPMVCVVAESSQQQFGIRLWALLLNFPHIMSATNLMQEFQKKYGFSCNMHQIEKYTSIVQIEKKSNGEVDVSLTPRYVVAARLYHLLFEAGGTIYLGNIDGWYQRKFGEILRPAEFGAASLNALLAQLSFVAVTKGRRHKRNVSLNINLPSYGVALPSVMKYLPNEQSSAETNNNSLQWPPPPAHTYLFNSGKTTISPPKPDTPPTNGHHNVWDGSLWNTSPNFSQSMNLCIPLPPAQTPSLLDNSTSLISPTKNLLQACDEPLGPPDPSQLPMPNAELLNKAKLSSPSRDSGISSTSITNSLEEPDSSTSFEMENKLTPTKKKRQMRLAAHFTNPLNLT